MIYTKTFQVPIEIADQESCNDHLEVNRLLAAAVVNTQFCKLLLEDPYTALQNGYLGETFYLTEEERALILSIRAATLPDLARELVRTFGERQDLSLTHSAQSLEFIDF